MTPNESNTAMNKRLSINLKAITGLYLRKNKCNTECNKYLQMMIVLCCLKMVQEIGDKNPQKSFVIKDPRKNQYDKQDRIIVRKCTRSETVQSFNEI